MAKAKGTTFLSLVKFLRTRADEARERLAPDLHHYLEEKIQTSVWYPEEDLLGLIRCMLELLPGDREANLVMMGQIVAQEHIEGVYGHLRVDADDPRTLGVRSFALWSSMHDSGALEVEATKPGEVVFGLADYGRLSEEMCKIICSYFTECMRLAGAAAPQGEETTCRRTGADACRIRVRWRAPAA